MAVCKHEILESKRGAGPCRIEAKVKLRNGKPNWWCRTHGQPAGAPDGAALSECPGAWLDPLSDDEVLELDLDQGETSVWGALPPAIEIGDVDQESGKVHVHHRPSAGAPKEIDRSFAMITLRKGDAEVRVEGTAAVAASVSELTGRQTAALTCPHCGEVHIDELKFATFEHAKHLCNSCGRNFRVRQPSISNPLAAASAALGLPERVAAVRPDRPLDLRSDDYRGITLFPTNAAIVTTSSRPEEVGIHVHAWAQDGTLAVDETYSAVTVDDLQIDEGLLRVLAVQRSLAHGAPIVSLTCFSCGRALVDRAGSFLEPSTHHICSQCGADTRTRRRVFVNPLASL